MNSERRHVGPHEKIAARKRHLLEGVPVSTICGGRAWSHRRGRGCSASSCGGYLLSAPVARSSLWSRFICSRSGAICSSIKSCSSVLARGRSTAARKKGDADSSLVTKRSASWRAHLLFNWKGGSSLTPSLISAVSGFSSLAP